MTRIFENLIFTLITIQLFCFSFCLHQPLQLERPVTMHYLSGNITIDYFTNPTQKMQKKLVVFCYTQSKIDEANETTDSTTGKERSCNLTDGGGKYKCIQVSYKTKTQIGIQVFNQTFTGSNFQDMQNGVFTTVKLQKDPIIGGTDISNNQLTIQIEWNQNLLKSIFHMFTCPDLDSTTNLCKEMWKQNYFHTFTQTDVKMGLLMQRFPFCKIYQDTNTTTGELMKIYNIIVYGGVLRSNQSVMIFGVLTYMSNQTHTLNMWGGISYSDDHANRDMFCFATDGTYFDGVSLFAGPILKDEDPAVNGEKSIYIIDHSYSSRVQKSFMHFIQYHRLYTTQNSAGDEVLMKKIRSKYGFAAQFNCSTQQNSQKEVPSCLYTPQKKNYDYNWQKHNLVITWSNTVSLTQVNILYQILILAIMILILSQ